MRGAPVEFGTPPAPTVTVRDARPCHAIGPALDELLTVARRANPKRQVLFVSKVLGKHLAVDPGIPILAGMALGEQVAGALASTAGTATRATAALADALRTGRRVTWSDLAPGAAAVPCTVVGFAETATGLTHAVRRELGAGPIGHTTRVGVGAPLLTVTESHSHAVDHAVHHDDPGFLDHDDPVVVVDDEFTTGATALDMILGIQRRWPRRHYVLASLIDWRSSARRREMVAAVAAVGAHLDSRALVDAEVDIGPAPDLATGPALAQVPEPSRVAHRAGPAVDVIPLDLGPPTAQCGWTTAHQLTVDVRVIEAAGELGSRRHGDTVLVLGLEELMYLPMLIGMGMGPGASTRSTTRSPIVPAHSPGYPIRDRIEFPSTNGGDGTRFLYNLANERYDDVFVVADGPHPAVDHPLFAELARVTDHLHLVALT